MAGSRSRTGSIGGRWFCSGRSPAAALVASSYPEIRRDSAEGTAAADRSRGAGGVEAGGVHGAGEDGAVGVQHHAPQEEVPGPEPSQVKRKRETETEGDEVQTREHALHVCM